MAAALIAVAVLAGRGAPYAGAGEPQGDDGAGAETSEGPAEAAVGGEAEKATAGRSSVAELAPQ